MQDINDIKRLHEAVIYPEVRVSGKQGTGSGSVIFSAPGETYVITCNHVISDLISVKKVWDSKVGLEVKKEFKDQASVEFFISHYQIRPKVVLYPRMSLHMTNVWI